MYHICDQCDAVCINGHLCHEFGCPVQVDEKRRAKAEEIREQWETNFDNAIEEEL